VVASRPVHWLKNLVVFAAVIFAQKLDEPVSVLRTIAAFGIFCLLSSSVYLLNDIVDVEEDRRHPWKRLRPVASGDLSLHTASAASSVLAVAGLLLARVLGLSFFYAAAAYILLTIFYHFLLKRLVIVDVLAVALGFVIRAVAGAEAIEVVISPWLLVCTTLLALFLGFAKRRQELMDLGAEAADHRSVLAHYSAQMLDQMIGIVAAATIVGYCLYTMWPETVAKFTPAVAHRLLYTIPFVLYGVLRYLYLVHKRDAGGRPERALLTDRPLLVNLLLYLAVVAWALYAR